MCILNTKVLTDFIVVLSAKKENLTHKRLRKSMLFNLKIIR